MQGAELRDGECRDVYCAWFVSVCGFWLKVLRKELVLWGHGVCVLAPGGAPSLDAGALILSEVGCSGGRVLLHRWTEYQLCIRGVIHPEISRMVYMSREEGA